MSEVLKMSSGTVRFEAGEMAFDVEPLFAFEEMRRLYDEMAATAENGRVDHYAYLRRLQQWFRENCHVELNLTQVDEINDVLPAWIHGKKKERRDALKATLS